MMGAGGKRFLDPGVRSAGISRQPRLPDAAFLIVPPVILDPLAQEPLHRAQVGIWRDVEGDHPKLLQPLAVHPQRREGIQHRLPTPSQGTVWERDHADRAVARPRHLVGGPPHAVAVGRGPEGVARREIADEPGDVVQADQAAAERDRPDPSLGTGGQPSSSWRSWKRTRTSSVCSPSPSWSGTAIPTGCRTAGTGRPTRPSHLGTPRRRRGVLEQAQPARNQPWSRVNVVALPILPGISYEGAA
jgi:hypothetical protein